MTEINERVIETDRGRVAYLEAGAGWPVVLLHAFPLNADMWRPQLERRAEGWRFIAPDLRGFGRSPLSATGGRGITMDDYAADVCALMDGLEIDDAVIGGLSMGGYVTFAMHRQSRRRVSPAWCSPTRGRRPTRRRRARGACGCARCSRRDGPRGVADQMLPKLLSAAARARTRPARTPTRAR